MGEFAMNSRREFIKTILAGGLMLGIPSVAKPFFRRSGMKRLVLLHTNDTHSQIEALPQNHPKYPGMGGYSRRSSLISKIRAEGYPVLLFDSGDIFQGTPYYNVYGGSVEIQLMSEIGYSGATLGNHEFDKGLDALAANISQADFPFISSNYDFSNTALGSLVKEYKIYETNGIKVGVFGLGINPEGLISPSRFGKTKYLDPVITAAYMSHKLKKELHCHLVICLSHIGYKGEDGMIGDMELAKQSRNIDIILGGHSHTFLSKPMIIRNSEDKEVVICQQGYAGINLGRVDCYFGSGGSLLTTDSYTINIFKNQV